MQYPTERQTLEMEETIWKGIESCKDSSLPILSQAKQSLSPMSEQR